MTILVCGGRDFDDYAKLRDVLDEVATWGDGSELLIVNGGYRGADQLASRWAKERGEKFHEEFADWNRDGKSAGPLRNQRMLDVYKPDFGVAFPGGSGTEDMLCRLFRAGVETLVVGGKNG